MNKLVDFIPGLLQVRNRGEAESRGHGHAADDAELDVCINCEAELGGSQEYAEYRICPMCRFHYSIGAEERAARLVDEGSFHEMQRGLSSIDPLSFVGQTSYRSRILDEQRRTGLSDAALTGTATIRGNRIVLGLLDFRFLGGSIGCAAGERITFAFEYATRRKLPVVMVVASGGIRLQEGLLSLAQVAKMVAAAERFSAAGLPLISLLANPTIGAAYASFVGLSDVIVAEPKAIVGYATTRALEASSGGQVHAGSNVAESQLEHGLIDNVIERPQQRGFLSALLTMLASSYRLPAARSTVRLSSPPNAPGAWSQVQLARHERRPTAREYIARVTTTFIEIRGDRVEGDDPAIVCGIGQLGGQSTVIIGQERLEGRAASIRPEGFRKARRAMLIANKLGLPLVSFVDTAGAAIELSAERHGLGAAIAGCIAAAAALRVPSVGIIIGEGGGEAALAFSVANRLLMMEHAVFAPTSPEAAATVLYRDTGQAEAAAAALRLTASDCQRLGIIDGIVPEPVGGAHTAHEEASRNVKEAILRELADIQGKSPQALAEDRYHKLRSLGRYSNNVARRLMQNARHFGPAFRDAAQHLGAVMLRPVRGSDSGAERLLFP